MELPDYIKPSNIHTQEDAVPFTVLPAPEEGDATTTAEAAEEKPQRESQAAVAVTLAEAHDLQLFHSSSLDTYASYRVGTHVETWALSSKTFQLWLKGLFYRSEGRPLSEQSLREVLGILEARAIYDSASHPVHLRVAQHDGAYYLDLSNETWQVVKITPYGWEVLDTSPVKFIRTQSMEPLPMPRRGGSLHDLRAFVNVTDEEWPLVLGYLAATLRPRGPYPLLVLNGEQGSSKSTTARVLRALVDPNKTPLRAKPRGEEDLMIAASNSHVLALDNLSHISPELSDALCRISTGGGLSRRKLYSDGEEAILDVQRPVMITGITDMVNRSDLLSRSIVLNLPVIPAKEHVTEEAFWNAFEEKSGAILGALLTAVAEGLAKLPTTKLDRLPRLADFAVWVSACEEALELAPGEFMQAYSTNLEDGNARVVEMSPLASAVIAMLEAHTGEIQMSPTELFNALRAFAAEDERRQKDWPKSVRGMTCTLKRLAPNLREIGIAYETGKTSGANSSRYVRLSRSHVPDAKNAENTEVTS